MSDIVADIALSRKWILRSGVDNKITFVFTSSGAVDISAYTFFLVIRSFGEDANRILLAAGSGLTKNGVAGTLIAAVTVAQSESIQNNEHFYMLYYTYSGNTKPLVKGTLQAITEVYEDGGHEAETTTVTLGGSSVTLEIRPYG